MGSAAPTHLVEWFTLAEIVPHVGSALPESLRGLAYHAERQGWSKDLRRCRLRTGKGGGQEFHYTLLPAEVQARITFAQLPPLPDAPKVSGRAGALWSAFEAAPPSSRLKASERLAAIVAVEAVQGTSRVSAVAQVAALRGISPRALFDWIALVAEVPRADRLAALLPRHAGRTVLAPCDPRAWDWIKADYLRPEQRCFETSYRDLADIAREQGWSPIPACKTLKRRMEREFTAAQITLARKGADAARRMYPAQRRDRSHFHALEAVNADGHKIDVHVKFEDGTVGRPILTVFQDLHSGVILACRVDRTENKEIVRLALADVVSQWGLPEKVWLDNGRHFASKWISGGQKTRYRFKVRDEEPDGILKALGAEVHFTTPYSGQSKPIERAFLDFCRDIAKHPAFAGAYTGRNTVEKPSNYGSHAVPIAEFEKVLRVQVARHNARPGRSSLVCAGKLSFLQAYERSLADGALIRRATPAQHRMLLLAADGVTARAPEGTVHLLGNRYWSETLLDHIGERLTVRFDPQDLAAPVAVYTTDNRFLCEAEAQGVVAFDDVTAAREHARNRKDWLRGNKIALDAERRLSLADVAALMPRIEDTAPPEPVAIRMVANGRPRVRDDGGAAADFAAGVAMLEAGGVLPFRRRGDDDAR